MKSSVPSRQRQQYSSFALTVAKAPAPGGGSLFPANGERCKMAALHEEPAEVTAVKPDSEAGTPPQPPTAPPAAAAAVPVAPSAAAAEGEAAGSGGEAAPPKPTAPGPTASPASLDRQTLVAVLQFLRRSNLRESEEILRREARLLGDDLGSAALSPPGAGLQGVPGGDADSIGGEALLSRVSAAAAIGGNVATVASSSPAVAAVAAVPPGKGGARDGTVGSLLRAGGRPLCRDLRGLGDLCVSRSLGGCR